MHSTLKQSPPAKVLPARSVRPAASLYVHLPFCRHRCDYCAFYTLAAPAPELRARYMTRLDAEMCERNGECGTLASVYIGGGTPTYPPADELEALLAMIRRYFTFGDNCEFTVEANPGSLTGEKLDVLVGAGVNRISLGAQSFSQKTRSAIGRGGTVDAISRAVDLIKDRGIRNFNLDLIYGVPGQTQAELDNDLEKFIALEPAHVSAYSLMIEEGTPLQRRGVGEGDDDTVASMWERTGEFFAAHGLERYEVSNYARPGLECWHNVDVWHGGRLLGVGPAACGFDGVTRWLNVPDMDRWLAGEAPAADVIAPEMRAAEILITGLRTAAGWTPDAFAEVSGVNYIAFRGQELQRLHENGLVELGRDNVRPTARGMLLHNVIGRALLSKGVSPTF